MNGVHLLHKGGEGVSHFKFCLKYFRPTQYQKKIQNLSNFCAYLRAAFNIGLPFLATVPDVHALEDNDTVSDRAEADSNMPVIRKKEHDFLGMFEYRAEQEQQILKALIYGKKFGV